MLHLLKLLPPLLRAASHPIPTGAAISSLHRRAFLSTSASAYPTPFPIKDYLVSTCGLTSAQAIQASKKLSNLKSASNADAMLALLSGVGLSRPDIAAVVVSDPQLLRARVGNIACRLTSLRDRVGLSDPDIARFLLAGGSTALRSCDVAPRLEFWIPFFGSFDKLLPHIRRNRCILIGDLEKVTKPNIALLEQCGLGACDVAKLLCFSNRVLSYSPERVKQFVLRADELGVPRSSFAFKDAVGLTSCVSEDKLAARVEFLRSSLGCSTEKFRLMIRLWPCVLAISEEKLLHNIEFLRSTLGRGCSKDKVNAAICKAPQLLGLTEEKLRCKIEFLVTEVGLEVDYIVEKPLLLLFSLEKRLVPRHYVVKILQAKGLMKEHIADITLMKYATTSVS